MDLGVGSLIGSTIGGLFNLGSTALSINASQQLAQQNRQWAREQWMAENRYNSPEAQMRRYKDAGLNPNLLYGNIQPGNAQPLRMNDPYNSKEISDALRSIDFQQMALGIAKAKEELKALKLGNSEKAQDIKLKKEQTDLASYNAHLKGMESQAAYLWAMSHSQPGGRYELKEADGTYWWLRDGDYSIRADQRNLPFYFLERWDSELKRMETGTQDIATRKELNELRKVTQDYINQLTSVDFH